LDGWSGSDRRFPHKNCETNDRGYLRVRKLENSGGLWLSLIMEDSVPLRSRTSKDGYHRDGFLISILGNIAWKQWKLSRSQKELYSN
jgi:hypothetical protein